MVDEEIVMETIRKMKESGLEDSIVISTLQDIGLTEEQAKDFIEKAASPAFQAKKPEPTEAVKPAERIQPEEAAKPTEWLSPEEEAAITEAIEEEPLEAAEIPVEETKPPAAVGAKPVPPRPAPIPARAAVAPEIPTEGPAAAPKEAIGRPESIVDRTAEKVKYHIAEHAEEDAMRHATTQAVLGEQSRRIEEMQKYIKRLESRPPIEFPEDTPRQIKAIVVGLESMKKDVEETKALAVAIRTLMEKILEVNRKILNRLP